MKGERERMAARTGDEGQAKQAELGHAVHARSNAEGGRRVGQNGPRAGEKRKGVRRALGQAMS